MFSVVIVNFEKSDKVAIFDYKLFCILSVSMIAGISPALERERV